MGLWVGETWGYIILFSVVYLRGGGMVGEGVGMLALGCLYPFLGSLGGRRALGMVAVLPSDSQHTA